MKNILRWVILGGLFLIPFVPFLVSSAFFFPFITTKAFAWRIIVEVIFGAWVILAALDPAYRPRKSLISWALLAFVVIVGLADAFGVAPMKSFWSNFERMEGYVTILHLGALYLVMSSFYKAKEWTWWWNTSLVASLLVCLYSFLQLAGSLQIHQGGARVDASFGNAAYLAVYILIHIFIALMFAFRQKKNSLLQWSYGILILLQVVVLYYTATRGAILGLIGGLIIVALLNVTNTAERGVRKASIVGLIALVVVIGGFFAIKNTTFVTSSPVLSRFSSISSSELKTEGRAFVWPMALQGIKERPLLGWGQENFNYVFNAHYSPAMYNLEPWFDRAHNIFLDWGISAGLFGLVAYLSLYVVLLYSVWKKKEDGTHVFSRIDRSLLTGLLAAYFFHNLFVFDYLASYILFIALLAFVHSNALSETKVGQGLSQQNVSFYVLSPVIVVIVALLYFVNIKPMMANMNLINGLRSVQTPSDDKATVLGSLQSAYNQSRLGRPETVEWIASAAPTVLQSSLTNDQKNAYYDFAKKTVLKQADDLATDARYQLIAGAFLSTVGDQDGALTYLDRAEKLSPGKQTVYFQEASVLQQKKQYKEALVLLKKAYDMAPGYKEAQIQYLIGALYAGDITAANSLSTQLSTTDIITDDRIAAAMYAVGRYSELVSLFKARIALAPDNAQAYVSLAAIYMKMSDKTDAILILKEAGDKVPSFKATADTYIQQIQNGVIKPGV